MLKFQNKTILVTGSGTGIGLAVTKKFVENGASAILVGRRKEPLVKAAEMLEGIIKENQSKAIIKIFPGVDVSDEESVTKMFNILAGNEPNLDVLVNNAGVSGPVTCFAHAPEEDFDSTIDIHLTGTFWTSVQALRIMRKGAKIITISTFFAEERPLEQRPYRFRSPYTASQGAKNRLVEAMSWELTEKGIISIGTNPGPVHSDRIYKTVYPKAASEFLRVSGFEDLSPSEVEAANNEIVGLLGESDETIKAGIKSAAEKLGKPETTLTNLLDKIKTIAEKIQKNTSTMIPDQQFLSQEQVATTILTLADDVQAKILNGKIIPGDRVFYPVKPHVASSVPKVEKNNFDGKIFYFDGGSINVSNSLSMDEYLKLNPPTHNFDIHVTSNGGKFQNLSSDTDLMYYETGDLGYETSKLTDLDRGDWDGLVHQFIKEPARFVRESLDALVPSGSDDPRLFKDAKGRIVIVGPALPVGKKISGHERAKIEVFRGALRPFVTTVNQELSDVLKSNIRVFLILPGSIDGKEPRYENIINTINYLMSDESGSSSEVIFCPDETR
jgi:NAD(P)-dependent dehydrogenase (short-subunit alcohol dehydrogenase family)